MKKRLRIGELALIALVSPVVAALLGVVYSWPAMSLTKGREPWLTLLLACGLAITVFGLGMVMGLSLDSLDWVYAASIALLLLARRAFGGLGHNMERFGMVHLATLMFLISLFGYHLIRTKPQDKEQQQQTAPIRDDR